MNVEEYLKSIGLEVASLQQRVRFILSDAHWQTDGEWKESVLRQVLRRCLPTTAQVSRGFVVGPTAASTQIDILIHKASAPVLFRDGDLVFVTPDAVLGLLEVKSRVDAPSFRDAAAKLCRNAELVRVTGNHQIVAGLFAFETAAKPSDLWLDHVFSAAPTWNHRLSFAALGPSVFLRYWDLHPERTTRLHRSWHAYELPDLATGYFVHNVVEAVSEQSVIANTQTWYPKNGKERHRFGVRHAAWRRPEDEAE